MNAIIEKAYPSFTLLKDQLHQERIQMFMHRYKKEDGKQAEVELPKYLYRGEPDLYPTTTTAHDRMLKDERLTEDDKHDVLGFIELSQQVWGSRTGDGYRAVAWAQHYGFPTNQLDVTHILDVALHFAASSPSSPPSTYRRIYRIDFERLIGRIQAISIAHSYCIRGRRQGAWGLLCCGEDGLWGQGFDLQSDKRIRHGIEKFVVEAIDADEYIMPELLDDQHDGYATWPVAIVRGYKFKVAKPLSLDLSTWLCNRIPLYDWIPCDVHFGLFGISETYSLRSPATAEKEDSRNYRIGKEELIEELTSNRYQTPNPVLFALLRDAPFTTRRIGPGSRFDVVTWMGGFPEVPFGPE